MPENKTQATTASVEDYLASRANERQIADCRALMALFEKITGEAPRMWGPSIVGHGSYRYTYESGRSGAGTKWATSTTRPFNATAHPPRSARGSVSPDPALGRLPRRRRGY